MSTSIRARTVVFVVALTATAFVPARHRIDASSGASPGAGQAAARAGFTFEQVASSPFPNELTASARGSRLAWAFNEQGRRNIWVAEGPAFTARQLTSYDRDDGQELTGVALSPAGDWVVYVRGGDHGSNWDDRVPVNATSSPTAPPVMIWSVPFAGGEPKALGEGDAPAISPRGDVVVFERDRHLWLVPVDGSAPARRIVAPNGTSVDAGWSPDGSRLAFVSNRGDHAFIGVYSNADSPITWLAPSTSRDTSPRWSPDGRRIAFVRRPGLGGAPEPVLERRHAPWAIHVADAGTGEARQIWKAPETLRGSYPGTHGNTNLHWAAKGRIVFLSYHDGWPHLYSVPESGGDPLLLTPGDYMAEHIRLGPDGTHLVFAGNTGDTPGDVDRRHVVMVPVDRAAPRVITPGTGLEWTPVVTGDLAHVAYIGATAQRAPLPVVMPTGGGRPSVLAADRVPADFPATRLVTPTQVTYTASDGVKVHAQLFDAASGSGRRPAIIYVHGGPPRQMLLGWHYSDYYSRAYASNQYLASRGFVVLSINYRLGIGYGYEFHRPPAAGAQGASEYLDVKAAAEYLKTVPEVDGSRIGIYGGSYGGYLTALALARDSGLFAAGVDIHGVHNFTARESGAGAALQAAMAAGGRFEPSDREKAAEVAWRSSPVSSIATWTSPVLLIHGDDDRNVRFSQTVDLVRRLSAAGVRFEELVIPDDTHHWMRHANVVRVYKATADYFERVLRSAPSSVAPPD
jgi:dipeptidyl aminopeptidase/acylaminoacyl peptidase